MLHSQLGRLASRPDVPTLAQQRTAGERSIRGRRAQGRKADKHVTLAVTTAAADGICRQKASWGAAERVFAQPPKLSKSDSDFARDGLEFMHGAEVPVGELNELFAKVSFPRRDPVQLTDALQRSHAVLWVRNLRQTRWARMGQLIGFARATSDGVCAATIWDVAVLPSWQKGGIGRGLMERLITELLHDGISAITLYAEPKVVRMYERLGFDSDPSGIKGLAFRRNAASGAYLMEREARPTRYISIVRDSSCDRADRDSAQP